MKKIIIRFPYVLLHVSWSSHVIYVFYWRSARVYLWSTTSVSIWVEMTNFIIITISLLFIARALVIHLTYVFCTGYSISNLTGGGDWGSSVCSSSGLSWWIPSYWENCIKKIDYLVYCIRQSNNNKARRHNITEKPFGYPKPISESCLGFQNELFRISKLAVLLCLYVRNTKYIRFLKLMFRMSHFGSFWISEKYFRFGMTFHLRFFSPEYWWGRPWLLFSLFRYLLFCFCSKFLLDGPS